MKILILGLGVIGTTYGFVFQKKGYQVEHLVRDSKKDAIPSELSVHILDGRKNKKGLECSDFYNVFLASANEEYDFIIVSVSCGKLDEAISTLREKNIRGTLLLFCNFWNTREEIERMVEGYQYIIGFPTAGGRMAERELHCVLFDHITLEHKDKTNIKNYNEIEAVFLSADIKTEKPHDMVEWIWIHMAVNAGVVMAATKNGNIDNPAQLAIALMDSSKALSNAVMLIRETTCIVAARSVELKYYHNEISPYKFPAKLAGIAMKRLFKNNELTRRIMTLHNGVDDILFGCASLYETGKQLNISVPLYYSKYELVQSNVAIG